MRGTGNAQFGVSKSCILRNPRQTYENIWHYLKKRKVHSEKYLKNEKAVELENFWMFLFSRQGNRQEHKCLPNMNMSTDISGFKYLGNSWAVILLLFLLQLNSTELRRSSARRKLVTRIEECRGWSTFYAWGFCRFHHNSFWRLILNQISFKQRRFLEIIYVHVLRLTLQQRGLRTPRPRRGASIMLPTRCTYSYFATWLDCIICIITYRRWLWVHGGPHSSLAWKRECNRAFSRRETLSRETTFINF